MRIYKVAENHKEMEQFFIDRTNKHIALVEKYCKKIYDYDPDKFADILDNVKKHDQTKFHEPELEPYIYTTWKYKCKAEGKEFECPEDIEKQMEEATIHHIINEEHHPEHWCGRKTNLLNKEDRDKPPSEIVDGTKMPDVNIAEMVADWCAVSEERKSHPKNWAYKNIDIRWKFSHNQKEMICELIEEIWDE